LSSDRRQDLFAAEIEHVSDSQAVRLPDYAVGLDAATLAMYDPPDARLNYTIIQEHLCDLRLPERRTMGKMLLGLRRQLPERTADMTYRVFFSDRKDFLYVLAASKGLNRPEILKRAQLLVLGGLAQYGRTHGMIIVNRDGVGFETGLIRVPSHSPQALAVGEKLFGHLRMMNGSVRLLPEDGWPARP